MRACQPIQDGYVERDGVKIYISKKTIVTPSARDLGDEKEVFATIYDGRAYY